MRIKVVEPLNTITAVAQDFEKLIELKSKLKAVDVYIQAPNVQAKGFIQLINVILELLPNAPAGGWVSRDLEFVSVRPRVMAFDVGLALYSIAEAAWKRDRAGLLQVQADLRCIEELIYGKLNEPSSAFVKLIDVLLPLLPDPVEKIEAVEEIKEQEEPAESLKVIEEQDPDPTTLPQKTLPC